jgi:formate-dependent nitrite reductase membrane component NrfD
MSALRAIKQMTMIEWLVIFAICSILAAMLIPALAKMNQKHNRPSQPIVYHIGDTVWVNVGGQVIRGQLTYPPER